MPHNHHRCRAVAVWRSLLVAALCAALAACGGGGSSASSPLGTPGSTTTASTASSAGTTSSSTTTTTTTTTGSIALSLSANSITTGSPATVTATLTDATGNPVPQAVITFTTDATYGVISPSSGTALTDTAGKASVLLNAASVTAAGASTITATAAFGSISYATARGYTVGSPSVQVSTPVFGTNPLSAFGNTSVTVKATSNGVALAGQLVTFSSSCTASGKAKLTSSAVTNSSGDAQATYQDSGCGASDPVTAAASGLASATATLQVSAPSVGSIQYVSAQPSNITLKGTGGQESATVTFKVVDMANQPLGGKDVSFALNTTVGGILLSTATAKSNDKGEAAVIVQAGTVATPVRVTATTVGQGGAILTTQSNQLLISTGIPDQDSVSLSASSLNIEGWSYDGTKTSLTMRLADHFNNPVPDGTAISFVAEGGSIQSGCTTVAGACSVELTSQNPRPSNGRVTVLAYAIGEESFTDLNGNGKADTGEYANTGEAFSDGNENTLRDTDEPYIEFNGNNQYDNAAADSNYSGVLCNSACSAQKSLHVWQNIEIVFASSDALIGLSPPTLDLGGCPNLGRVVSGTVSVADLNGNPMPVGTTISLSSTNGVLDSESSVVQPNTNQAGAYAIDVRIKNDSKADSSAGTCADPTPDGLLRVTVTTPKGLKTTTTFPVTN